VVAFTDVGSRSKVISRNLQEREPAEPILVECREPQSNLDSAAYPAGTGHFRRAKHSHVFASLQQIGS